MKRLVWVIALLTGACSETTAPRIPEVEAGDSASDPVIVEKSDWVLVAMDSSETMARAKEPGSPSPSCGFRPHRLVAKVELSPEGKEKGITYEDITPGDTVYWQALGGIQLCQEFSVIDSTLHTQMGWVPSSFTGPVLVRAGRDSIAEVSWDLVIKPGRPMFPSEGLPDIWWAMEGDSFFVELKDFAGRKLYEWEMHTSTPVGLVGLDTLVAETWGVGTFRVRVDNYIGLALYQGTVNILPKFHEWGPWEIELSCTTPTATHSLVWKLVETSTRYAQHSRYLHTLLKDLGLPNSRHRFLDGNNYTTPSDLWEGTIEGKETTNEFYWITDGDTVYSSARADTLPSGDPIPKENAFFRTGGIIVFPEHHWVIMPQVRDPMYAARAGGLLSLRTLLGETAGDEYVSGITPHLVPIEDDAGRRWWARATDGCVSTYWDDTTEGSLTIRAQNDPGVRPYLTLPTPKGGGFSGLRSRFQSRTAR